MTPDNNLVLTGFMGTGKTTVGQQLAQRLGREFVDTDLVIEARHGPIDEIFRLQGESAFREIERSLAIELGERKGLVIATGGRMLLDPQNFQALSRNGRIFCLVATPEEIYDRVTGDKTRVNRPLLEVADPKQRIIELLTERAPNYERFPQLTTDQVDPGVIAEELASLWSGHDTYPITSPSGGYEFTVGAGILPFLRQLATIRGPVALITDDVVHDLYGHSLGDVDLTIVLPVGRNQKTIGSVQIVYDRLLEAGFDRTATVVSLGSSTIGDIAGFAAATYLRGVDLVHCPTNLIAMIDTSIGGKVGLDAPQGRNLIGLYKQPKAVLADVATLQTLPDRDFISGAAEVMKHGLVASSFLLDHIEKTNWREGSRLSPGALANLQYLVAQAIQIKIAIVQEDPFEETGRRTVLNLGHTFAYAIEHATHGEWNHGEAVAVGLVAASRLSELKGYASSGLSDRVESLVSHVGLSTRLPEGIQPRTLIEAMQKDKKRRGSQLRFVLLRDVGDPFVADDISELEVLEVLEGMLDTASGRGSHSLGDIAAHSAERTR
ncbi:MAG TPA: bifunctional shikimate kinase/3-dehydroquinate synthase [Acidimicrobiia bacterium]|nr:bifunctional shikimate kinase/3-dehydroquinate synthase [Acidimicrobiia bacterium]